ncbi:MAG: hypothetical protein WC460_06910 [Patescibacteria group bacterium]
MNKNTKIALLNAAFAGDRQAVDRLLMANENRIFVEMVPGKYCTHRFSCECKEPEKCRHLKDDEQLRSVYLNATYIQFKDYSGNTELAKQCSEFGFPPPQQRDVVYLRNNIIDLQKKLNDEK